MARTQAGLGVRRAFVVGLALAVLGAGQVLAAASAPAALAGWDVEEVTSTVALSASTTNVVTLNCPTGFVPLSGGVYRTDGDPLQLRLASESVRSSPAVSSSADYRAVVPVTPGSAVEVAARLVCAKADSPLTITAVEGVLDTLATGGGLAVANTVPCPEGTFAINASLDPTATADDVSDAWLVHSSPSHDGAAWHAMAATFSRTFVADVPVVVHCLATDDVPGASVAHTINSIGTAEDNSFVEQACPSGTAALAGGAYGSQNASTTPDRSVDTPRISQWHPTSGLSARRAAALRFRDTHTGVVSVALCWRVPTPPVVTVVGQPPALSSTGDAVFEFTWSGGGPTTIYCHLDSGTEQECASPVSYAGLPDGGHAWHWRAINEDGDESTGSYAWTIDTTNPTGSMTAPGNGFTLSGTTGVGWTGSDAGSGLDSFDIYTRIAPYNFGFIKVPTPQTYDAEQTNTTISGLTGGTTYCFAAEAVDNLGWRSVRTAERCVSTPADDRKLTASAGWTRKAGTALYDGTESVSKTRGSTLRLANARVARIAVVATKCPGCGTIGVYAGSTRVGRLSLASTTVKKKQVLLLPGIPVRTATVVIEVLSSAKPVRIDGLGVSRN